MMQPEFTQEEYDRRIARIQRSLADSAIAGLLIVDEINYRYATGHYTEAWKNPSRRRGCWITPGGNPVVVVAPGEGRDAQAANASLQVVEYGGPSIGSLVVGDDPVLGFELDLTSAIVDTGRELGLERRPNLGIAMGGWTRLDVPAGVLAMVQEGLRVPRWIDASPILWGARMIKSEPEIEYMRRSVKALDDAFAWTLAEAQAGMDELTLARTMRANILRAGADHDGYTIAVADVRRPRSIGSAPGEYALEPGGMMMIDAGAIVHGYTSDYNRMAVVGEPSDLQRAAYELVVRALHAGIDAAKPGVRVGDVTQAMQRVLDGGRPSASVMGRMGHGLGLDVPEPPSFHAAAEAQLTPGMLVCIEPSKHVDRVGTLIAEDVFVVRDSGIECLSMSPTPPELLTV
jgi:Xaa-Pro aminopeptidase